MKIIGYQTKGNVIRFYLGSPDLKPKFPKVDDFCINPHINKAPGIYPYSDFVVGYRDVVVAWNKTVFTVKTFTLSDITNQITPLLVIADSDEGDYGLGYDRYKGAKDAICYYFWDDMEPDVIGLPDNYPGVAIDD